MDDAGPAARRSGPGPGLAEPPRPVRGLRRPPPQLLTWTAVPLVAVALAGAGPGPLLADLRVPRPGQLGALLAAAGVVAALVSASALRLTRRVPWPALLVTAWVGAVALGGCLGHAEADRGAGVARPVSGYSAAARAAAGAPGSWLSGADARVRSAAPAGAAPAWRWHGPARVLVVDAAQQVRRSDTGVAVVLLLLGAAAVPLLLVSVRSLAGDSAARDLSPLAVALPGAALAWGSVDAATAAVALGAVAWGVTGAARRRGLVSAAGAGVLLGAVAAADLVVVWGAAAALVCTYFARRRPLLNLVTAVSLLLPLALWHAAGFTYPAGLTTARIALGARPLAAWLLPSVVALLLAAGPGVVGSLASWRRTPAWPLVVGGGSVVVLGSLLGLARGGAERAWWGAALLLVSAATATPADRRGTPWLVAGSGLAAVVLAAVAVPSWAVG